MKDTFVFKEDYDEMMDDLIRVGIIIGMSDRELNLCINDLTKSNYNFDKIFKFYNNLNKQFYSINDPSYNDILVFNGDQLNLLYFYECSTLDVFYPSKSTSEIGRKLLLEAVKSGVLNKINKLKILHYCREGKFEDGSGIDRMSNFEYNKYK